MTESRDESAPVCQTCGHPVGPDAHVFDWGGEPGQEGCRACLGLRGDQTSVIGHPFVPERTGDDEAREEADRDRLGIVDSRRGDRGNRVGAPVSTRQEGVEVAGDEIESRVEAARTLLPDAAEAGVSAAAPVGTLPDASCPSCGLPRSGPRGLNCVNTHAGDGLDQPPTPEPVTPTETTCERCGGPNPIAWHAPSPLWNAVMRESGHEEIGFICPRCFIEVAQERGIDGSWQLSIDGRDFAGTVSPDGRVWNPATCLWEPVTPEPVCRCRHAESDHEEGHCYPCQHETDHLFAPTGEPEQVPDLDAEIVASAIEAMPHEALKEYALRLAANLDAESDDRAAAEEQVRVLTEAIDEYVLRCRDFGAPGLSIEGRADRFLMRSYAFSRLCKIADRDGRVEERLRASISTEVQED